jgi:hypothetical protein
VTVFYVLDQEITAHRSALVQSSEGSAQGHCKSSNCSFSNQAQTIHEAEASADSYTSTWILDAAFVSNACVFCLHKYLVRVDVARGSTHHESRRPDMLRTMSVHNGCSLVAFIRIQSFPRSEVGTRNLYRIPDVKALARVPRIS